MAERDLTPVSVRLDRKRGYRNNDSDKRAKWVGPGMVTIPKWVADHWGVPVISPAQVAAAGEQTDSGAPPEATGTDPTQPPLDGYDNMTADQIIKLADNASDEMRAAIVAYESTRRRPRKSIIEELS